MTIHCERERTLCFTGLDSCGNHYAPVRRKAKYKLVNSSYKGPFIALLGMWVGTKVRRSGTWTHATSPCRPFQPFNLFICEKRAKCLSKCLKCRLVGWCTAEEPLLLGGYTVTSGHRDRPGATLGRHARGNGPAFYCMYLLPYYCWGSPARPLSTLGRLLN